MELVSYEKFLDILTTDHYLLMNILDHELR